jgi:hypothetical protein
MDDRLCCTGVTPKSATCARRASTSLACAAQPNSGSLSRSGSFSTDSPTSYHFQGEHMATTRIDQSSTLNANHYGDE